MSQERLKVLELLSSGKIDANQAAQLLQNLTPVKVAAEPKPAGFADELANLKARVGGNDPQPEAEPAAQPSEERTTTQPSKLRVRVMDDTGQQHVNISIPFKLLKFGASIGERFAPELGEWDWQNLDIDVEGGNGHVHIFVE